MSFISTMSLPSLPLICFLGLLLGLSGCAQTPKKATTASSQPAHAAQSTQAPSQAQASNAPIPTETLYALLTAEIAGQRQRYDVALVHYLRQAEATQNPQIAERAARIAQYVGRPEAMQQALDIWLANDQDNPTAHLVAAHVAIEQNNFTQALSHFNYFYAQTGQGQYDYLAAHSTKLPEAEQQSLLQKLLEQRQQHPKEATLWMATALIQQDLGNYPQALKETEKAIALDPQMLSAQLQKARLLALQDKTPQAIQYLNKIQKRHPEHKGTQVLKARFLLEQQRNAEALEAFSQLHSQFPDDLTLLFSLALLHEELQQFEPAKEYFQELLAAQEYTNEAHFYLGRIAEAEQQFDLAIEQYSQVGGGKEFLAAQMRAAVLTKEQHGLDNAREHFQQQRQLYPQHEIMLTRMEADLLISAKAFEQAEQVLSASINKYPEHLDLLYSRAMLAESQGDLATLEQDLRYILAIDPNNINALNALGYTFADHNIRLDEALALVQQAYKLSPNNAAIIDSLGWVYFRHGDIDQALPLLQQAFELIPDHEIAAHLGEVLWLTEQPQQAKQVWRKGLENYPDSPVIRKTLERLEIVID